MRSSVDCPSCSVVISSEVVSVLSDRNSANRDSFTACGGSEQSKAALCRREDFPRVTATLKTVESRLVLRSSLLLTLAGCIASNCSGTAPALTESYNQALCKGTGCAVVVRGLAFCESIATRSIALADC